MEAERRTSKGGFLHLFDWNSKSRRKLFSNKSELPNTETSKYGEQNDVKSSNYPHLGENGHRLTGKSTGDVYGAKTPGIVARLMGLDCLPTSAVPDPMSTPFGNPSFPLNSSSQRCTSNHRVDYHYVNYITNERGSGNLVDPRLQKVHSRPIKRYPRETLPPKSAKPIPVTHHQRLLSPIKNPGFVPANDLACIVEASSNILDQCPQSAANGKKLSFVSSSVPLRVRDVKERMEAEPRASVRPAFGRPKESVVSQYNRERSRKNHSGSIDTQTNNVQMSSERETSVGLKNKGTPALLAVQVKVNVQGKEGFRSGDSRRSAIRKEADEVKNSQRNQSEMTMQRSVQKRNSTSRSSGVCKQNHQTQNCANTREKLPPKAFVRTQQNSKSPPLNGCVRPVKASTKVLNSGSGPGKINTLAKEITSSKTKAFSKKKQLSCGNITTDKDHKREIKCNITHDDCSSWDACERKSSVDVVAFTFTSPVKKSHTVSGSSGHLMEKGNKHRDDINYSPKNPISYSPRSNVTCGDALSALLEQKLKELTCQVELTNYNFDNAGSASSTFNVMDTIPRGQCIGFELNLQKAESSACGADGVSSDGLMLNDYGKWQGLQEIEGQSSGNSNNDYGKECDGRFASLRSTIEPSSSDGSYDSSDLNSFSSAKGSKRCHLINPHEEIDCISTGVSPSLGVDLEFSDSASTSSVAFASGYCDSPTISLIEIKGSVNWELEYIRKVLFSSNLVLDDLVLGLVNKVLNPNLFDHLANSHIAGSENTEEYSKLEWKVLFDRVGECLDLRAEQLLGGGNNKALLKWEILFQNKAFLAEDLYKEISSRTSVGDLMVDELVDKDMNSGKGKWIDFETEAFEEGVEIEKAILSSLVDELVADMKPLIWIQLYQF